MPCAVSRECGGKRRRHTCGGRSADAGKPTYHAPDGVPFDVGLAACQHAVRVLRVTGVLLQRRREHWVKKVCDSWRIMLRGSLRPALPQSTATTRTPELPSYPGDCPQESMRWRLQRVRKPSGISQEIHHVRHQSVGVATAAAAAADQEGGKHRQRHRHGCHDACSTMHEAPRIRPCCVHAMQRAKRGHPRPYLAQSLRVTKQRRAIMAYNNAPSVCSAIAVHQIHDVLEIRLAQHDVGSSPAPMTSSASRPPMRSAPLPPPPAVTNGSYSCSRDTMTSSDVTLLKLTPPTGDPCGTSTCTGS